MALVALQKPVHCTCQFSNMCQPKKFVIEIQDSDDEHQVNNPHNSPYEDNMLTENLNKQQSAQRVSDDLDIEIHFSADVNGDIKPDNNNDHDNMTGKDKSIFSLSVYHQKLMYLGQNWLTIQIKPCIWKNQD